MLENELQEKYGHSTVAIARARTKRLYHSTPFQFSVAGLIILAFAVDVLEASLLPPPRTIGAAVFFWADVSITGLFAMELLTNIFGTLKRTPRESARAVCIEGAHKTWDSQHASNGAGEWI